MPLFNQKRRDLIREMEWDIVSIGAHLEELQHLWANPLDVTASHWRIMLTLAEPNGAVGMSVTTLAKTLHLDETFVARQATILEKDGLVHFRSKDDGIARLSLTENARAQLANISARQRSLNEFISNEFASDELEELIAGLGSVRTAIEKACSKLAIERE